MSTTSRPILGPVTLKVSNLARMLAFYRTTIGLKEIRADANHAELGTRGVPLVTLEEDPAAKLPGRSTGLYHLAILLPSRPALGGVLQHLINKSVPLQGVADHLVSEAIYLADPEGNGIELYRDRPKEQWPYEGGQVQMSTDSLDVRGLLAEADKAPRDHYELPAGTTMGHVHLRVSDLPAAEAFYRDLLGLDLTTRFGRSASFLSYDGYHHHIGINTWESVGAPPASNRATGLKHFHLRVPGKERWERIEGAIKAGLLPAEKSLEGWMVRDPSGNGIVLTP